MESSATPFEAHSAKPIRIGLTCWRWQWRKATAIERLARQFGVTVQLTETISGLHREIEAQVSGANLDQFLSAFARQC
ncbi:MAG TPA: hypothetical protein VL200_00725 [Lacunisphaera sp.]|nr:hypothetical protein [Lacunisphaera sp.]